MESQSTFGIARHVVVGVVVVVGNSCREGADVRAVRGIVWVQNGHNGTIFLRSPGRLAGGVCRRKLFGSFQNAAHVDHFGCSGHDV